MEYAGIQRDTKEETLKSLVHGDYFSIFGYEPNIDNIDFVLTDKRTRDDLFSDVSGSSKHYLWAEAKKGMRDVFDMFTQCSACMRWLGCPNKDVRIKLQHLYPKFCLRGVLGSLTIPAFPSIVMYAPSLPY